MRHHVGVLMQLSVLVFLPILILWQLSFNLHLIVMPLATVAGIFLFWLGTRLRESK